MIAAKLGLLKHMKDLFVSPVNLSSDGGGTSKEGQSVNWVTQE
jgi:hypothetical protein